jgi:hypothetical protein
MTRSRSKWKTVLFSVITIALSVSFSFVLLELVLAKYYVATEEHVSEMIFDPTLGWKPRPGSRWVKPAHTFRTHNIFINDVGLRNREITPGKQTNIQRVIVLGDSFTFARAVQSSDSFPSLLETRLNQSGRFEVINAGVPGYGTAQELLLMQVLATNEIVGDVYVLMVFDNDILDNLRLDYGNLKETPARPGFMLQQDGELKQVSYPRKEYSESLVPAKKGPTGLVTLEVLKRQAASFLQTSPKVASLIAALGFEQKMPRMPGVVTGWYNPEVLAAGVPLTKALMREIQIETRKHGAKFLVAMIPSPVQVYPEVYGTILRNTFPKDKSVEDYLGDQTRPQKIIGTLCHELEVPFLDLLPILLSSNEKELYIPLEGHFTTEGHVVAAQHLATFIEKYVSTSVAGSR